MGVPSAAPSDSARRVLVIGYGNPGRLDDGLGPALAAELEAEGLPGVSVECNYQLQIEDASEAAAHDLVIFIDAAVKGAEPFYVQEVQPKAQFHFSTHSLDPASVLGLAHELFSARARGFVVGIRGYEFNAFGERLSKRASSNLAAASHFLKDILKKPHPEHLLARCEQRSPDKSN